MVPNIPMWLSSAHYVAPAGNFRGSAAGFAAGIALTFTQDPVLNGVGLMGNWTTAGEDGFRLGYSTVVNQGQLELELGLDTGGSASFAAPDLHLLGTTRLLVLNVGAGVDPSIELWMNAFKVLDTTLGAGDSFEPSALASTFLVGAATGLSLGIPAQFGVHGAFYQNRTLTASEILSSWAGFSQAGSIIRNPGFGGGAAFFDSAWDRQGMILPGQSKVSPDTWAPSAQSGSIALTQSGVPVLNNLASLSLNMLAG